MKSVTEKVEHPVPLGALHTMMEDFLAMGVPADALISVRRVGRETTPIEISCQWEGALTPVPADADE